MKYAIFRAAGGVGKELGRLLAEEKSEFRVVGRSEGKLREGFGDCEPYAEYCAADLMKSRTRRLRALRPFSMPQGCLTQTLQIIQEYLRYKTVGGLSSRTA